MANLRDILRRGGIGRRTTVKARPRLAIQVESLDPRQLLASLVAGPNINISHRAGNQSEQAVAINPTNPLNVVAMSNTDVIDGMFFSQSFDGGSTWQGGRLLGDGSGGLLTSLGDPSLAFDSFGTLYASSLHDDPSLGTSVSIYSSVDGGRTFTQLANILGAADQPTIRTGPGATPGSQTVWVTYVDANNTISNNGAVISGLGNVGAFSATEVVPNSLNTNYGDITIGPKGQVMVTMQGDPISGPSKIYTALDPDGLGPQGFSAIKDTSDTFVSGTYPIPPQPGIFGIDAEPNLAYDRSGGIHNGRVYLSYVSASAAGSVNTDIFLRYSDNDGTTWSAPIRVNDDKGVTSQFNPAIAVDQVTGNVGLDWIDSRDDPTGNMLTRLYATVSLDGGNTFLPNVAVARNQSTQANGVPPAGLRDLDYGDYGAVAFYNNNLYCVWADNSTGLGGNPNLPTFDLAGANVALLGLTVTASPFTATEATAFTGTVATFVSDTTSLPATAFTATIQWGDGKSSPANQIVPIVGSPGQFQVIGTHTYPEGGTYPVVVTVSQLTNTTPPTVLLSNSSSSSVTVAGLPITAVPVPAGGVLTLNEGQKYTGALVHFTDANVTTPQLAAHYAATIDFGDGSKAISGAIVASPLGGFDVFDRVGHLYGGGRSTITVTISDPGTSTATTIQANVTDSQIVAVGRNIAPLEGRPFSGVLATFTDQDPRPQSAANYSATIDWGDGTTSAGTIAALTTGGFEVRGDHTYSVGTFPVTVTIANGSGPNTAVALLPGGGTPQAVVADAPLSSQGYSFAPIAGLPFVGVLATFTDDDPRINPPSSYKATVDWGDGSIQDVPVEINEDGGYLVRGGHAYRSGGTYTITTTIKDAVNPVGNTSPATTIATGTAVVPAAKADLTVAPNVAFSEGTPEAHVLGEIRSASPLALASDFTVTINYGDGTSGPAILVRRADPDGARFAIQTSKTYDLAGSYPIVISVTGGDGFQVRGASTATVSAAAISVQPVPVSGVSRTNLTGVRVATFTSANPSAKAGSYSASIDWGDGSTTPGVVTADGSGGFVVSGNHTYAAGGSYTAGVVVSGKGVQSAVTDVVTIENLLVPIEGRASSAVDGSVSAAGVTSSTQPIFTGKADPFASVQIFATPSGSSSPTLVGTATADASGNFSLTSSPLADGQYTVTASATDRLGKPSSTTTVLYPSAGRGLLTVDTQGPKVTSVRLDRKQGTATIEFSDGGSGLSPSLLDPSNYTLRSSTGKAFRVTSVVVQPGSSATNQTVTVTFANARALKRGTFVLTINTAGTTDQAGNTLDERFFVPFPGSYTQAGQDFTVAFTDNLGKSSRPTQFIPSGVMAAAIRHQRFIRMNLRRR